MSFRKYFDRKKAEKRADELYKKCETGTQLRSEAVIKHRTFWPKTPYMPEEDHHEQAFILGYASREEEFQALTAEVRSLRMLVQDIETKR